MKNCKYTYYYLLALLCFTVSSCINEDVSDSSCTAKNPQISLTVKLSDTRASGAGEYDSNEERYINDIAMYIFSKDNKFIEKVASPQVMGTDGDEIRTLYAELTENYDSYTEGIEVVVLANHTARGITLPTLSVGDNKEALYSLLTYSYTPGNDWKFQSSPKQYIPMWGTYTSEEIHKGINEGSLNLRRAIARVDVLLNEGDGFSHFTPTGVTITRYNTKGYCAAPDKDAPNVPAAATVGSNASFSQPDAGKQVYRLYIPEYTNLKEGSQPAQIQLAGTLTTPSGDTASKTYTLDFKGKDATAVDNILRNHLYRFSITGITNEIEVTSTLSYEVEKWNLISVTVPPFN